MTSFELIEAPVRARTAGMVWSQRDGETAFTVPLFDRFMKRQMPTLERHVPARRPRSTRRSRS